MLPAFPFPLPGSCDMLSLTASRMVYAAVLFFYRLKNQNHSGYSQPTSDNKDENVSSAYCRALMPTSFLNFLDMTTWVGKNGDILSLRFRQVFRWLSVLIITDPGSVCQRSIIHTVALGENVVAITSSLLCAAQGLSQAVSSISASILLTIPPRRRDMFVIPFINIEIP